MRSTFRSFAKLNLTLELAGRRADGYHELRTLFQTVDLGDELALEPTARPGEIELEVANADLPGDDRNLAHRAARLVLERWGDGRAGVAIRLVKRIPLGAGLGGGSSNAATVLAALPALLGAAPTPGELHELARRLGADVPFFLEGGAALGLGRGDELTRLDDPLDGERALWLALPPWSLATAEVFAATGLAPGDVGRAEPGPEIARALAGRSAERLEDRIGPNDLEAPAFQVRPEEGALYTSLVRAGAQVVRMSGSGSALFALFDDSEAAEAVPDRLPPGSVWQKVTTLGRAAWREASGWTATRG